MYLLRLWEFGKSFFIDGLADSHSIYHSQKWLAETGGENMSKNRRLGLVIFLIISIVIVGVIWCGQFVFAEEENASNDLFAADKTRIYPVNENELRTYPVNENGQTYGVMDEYGTPDLIAAENDEGVSGFIKYEDMLDEGDFVQTPEEAMEYCKKRDALRAQGITYREIPMYESDGETVVGTFKIDV